jgi:hypothetical protein
MVEVYEMCEYLYTIIIPSQSSSNKMSDFFYFLLHSRYLLSMWNMWIFLSMKWWKACKIHVLAVDFELNYSARRCISRFMLFPSLENEIGSSSRWDNDWKHFRFGLSLCSWIRALFKKKKEILPHCQPQWDHFFSLVANVSRNSIKI